MRGSFKFAPVLKKNVEIRRRWLGHLMRIDEVTADCMIKTAVRKALHILEKIKARESPLQQQ